MQRWGWQWMSKFTCKIQNCLKKVKKAKWRLVREQHTPEIRMHAWQRHSETAKQSRVEWDVNRIKLETEMNREMHCNGLVVSPA